MEGSRNRPASTQKKLKQRRIGSAEKGENDEISLTGKEYEHFLAWLFGYFIKFLFIMNLPLIFRIG